MQARRAATARGECRVNVILHEYCARHWADMTVYTFVNSCDTRGYEQQYGYV